MEVEPSIGDTLRAWREIRGLTITQLAERVGRPIDKAYVSKLERGKPRMPSTRNLARLAEALEIPPAYLSTRRMPEKSGHSPAIPQWGGGISYSSPTVPTSSVQMYAETISAKLERLYTVLPELPPSLQRICVDSIALHIESASYLADQYISERRRSKNE